MKRYLRFSIGSLLWATLVVALLLAWAADRRRWAKAVADLEHQVRVEIEIGNRHETQAFYGRRETEQLRQSVDRLERESQWYLSENKRLETENRQLRISPPPAPTTGR